MKGWSIMNVIIVTSCKEFILNMLQMFIALTEIRLNAVDNNVVFWDDLRSIVKEQIGEKV